MARSQLGVQSDVPLPLHMHAAMFATGFIADPLSTTVPSVNEPLLQFVNAVFLFCVMSGSAETTKQIWWQIMYAFNS